ncbi:MAG: sodium:proton antiporter [Lachnospiraceae bacterium]|nr:sodium:proton antiporter [Lachnospiraceae bacterium]
MNVLLFLIIILTYIVAIGILNEKIFHLQSDISLMLFSLIISIILFVIRYFFSLQGLNTFIDNLGNFGFEEYLMDGALCFMLFAGAGKVNMSKFKQNLKPICLLALLTTLISSFLYGLLFYLISILFNLPMDIWTCILLGCVVSPTDPIAATGILNKIGLSKNVCSVIENESLFNDGTGVTLFIFVRSIIIHSKDSNFLLLMFKEIFGAAVIAFLFSWLSFKLITITREPIKYILISLLNVSLVYIICEHLGFSGVIASVICGMYYSYNMAKIERSVMVIDPSEYYKDFWEILESILNSVLFVMIGMLVLTISISKYIPILFPAAIIILILSRAIGVFISSILTKNNIPGNYDLKEFVSLMTWSALKGGLSLALAIGTSGYLNEITYNIFMNVTYISIFFTVFVQGLTVKKVYLALENHKAQRLKTSNNK